MMSRARGMSRVREVRQATISRLKALFENFRSYIAGGADRS
jgi:hypothetical protein